MKEYVFISYKSEEYEIASKIRSILTENEIDCWMAPESISGGTSYASAIPPAIRECKAFVVVLSDISQNSQYVVKEIDLAIKYKKLVLPFQIERCELNEDIGFYFSNVQIYAAYESWEANIEKLIREIRCAWESIPVTMNPYTIVNDKVKVDCTLPHVLDNGYLLFNRYKIEERTGTVEEGIQHYTAMDLHRSKTVLVKYLDRTVPNSKYTVGFSAVGAYFQHPYIATAIDEFSTDSYYVVIEPFYEVDSLDRVVRRQEFQDVSSMLKWAIPVCEAMIYLTEEMGYVYGALTTQNIRIQKNGLPILFDISAAGKIGTEDAQIAPFAMQYYHPKEYYLSLNITGDIYAMGVIMLYALTGKDYHYDDYFFEAGAIDNLDNVPKNIKYIIQKCIKTNPEDRYQTFSDLKSDLENWDKITPKKERKGWLSKLIKRNL